MVHQIKIEKNILYMRHINDPDTTYEMFPIRMISFISKITTMPIGDPKDGMFTKVFFVGMHQGHATIPSLPFKADDENIEVIQESINQLIATRNKIIKAFESHHAGIMIDKPKAFNPKKKSNV